jgi:Fe-S cluster assembly iron-binding protein IscA
MLTMTEAAGAHLARKLVEADDDMAIRFVPKRGAKVRPKWGLRLDTARPTDETFAHRGKTVLVLDEEVAELLANEVLDVKSGDAGPKLKLHHGAGAERRHR